VKEKNDLVDDALNATRAAVDPTKVVLTAAQDAVSSSPASGSSKSICGDGQGARADGDVWVIDVNDVKEERHR
jgi:hypothetical protein